MASIQVPAATLALVVAGWLAAADEPHHHPAPSASEIEKLGSVEFPVSCSKAAQQKFGRAVALLHSFWYAEAEKAFAEIGAKDAKCAMAHWGVAMSNFYPVWAAANPAAAPTPAQIAKGRAAAEKARTLAVKTSRERDYIEAVNAFYAGESDYPARALAFENAMEKVYKSHPQDRESGIFYSLALLGNAPPTDKTYARQKKAAEILNAALPQSPQHPGIAHYLIHCFDYPSLAELALPAARAYSKIAASSPHALHMPSHIFTRLALWNDSIESNLGSAATAKRHADRTTPGAVAFDELHALDYLAYAYLQQGRDDKAEEALKRVREAQKFDVPNFAAAYALAATPARWALERRQWKEASALVLTPASFPWAKFGGVEAVHHFARAVGGARGGDLETARAAVGRLGEIHKERIAAKDLYWASQVAIQKRAGSAWIALADGRKEEALTLMRSAADLEDMTEKHPVTPGSVLPARELLGDMLMETGDPARALAEYEASLTTAPGRLTTYTGAAMAAQQAGQTEKAKAMLAKLDALTAPGPAVRPEVEKVRAILKTN